MHIKILLEFYRVSLRPHLINKVRLLFQCFGHPRKMKENIFKEIIIRQANCIRRDICFAVEGIFAQG